ncbi:MAG: flagellar motor protein MotB [Rhizobiales bacterium TMED249]|uniref:Flagellar motor protein MotB n=1 Tax=PS1 clade bacterium TaxID=2175152 RepID=A0A368DV96_9PROT|nr:MAG: flagellar motor protein MotB [Rhizobiales bacterium TMED249]RCL75203.1 MAG: flagellar motor protein MotB [PS1 clade bacterium]HCV48613.1 flagellar motor protein MotB [Rhodobiaceae bacterium]|tara:strand:+ start:3482 stop:4669 length:1188 start_codon:yes stop_codon:yes gene_type:complete
MVAKEQEEEQVEETEEEECPKCPPVGAPAWMATFADMATLLMAFFVLILSFAEFNVPKFKQISGSLKNAFGVQRITPVVEPPMGTTILSLNFSPSPSPSVTNNMTQQTTQINQPKLEQKNKTKDDDFSEQSKSDDAQESSENQSAEDIVKALEDAIARGEIEVETLGEKVVVNFTPKESQEQDLPKLLSQTLDAIEKVQSAAGKSESDVVFGGLEQQLSKLADSMEAMQKQQNKQDAGQGSSEQQNKRAEIAEDTLKVALKQEIGQGLVTVDREDDRVVVTVGSGGAFASGSASLTNKARDIMSQIAEVNQEGTSRINVSGHTDNMPLVFGSQYRDNWDLAAARASSVVQELQSSGKIDGNRLQAMSFGEERPVDSNDTAQGRRKNRRIEIEINY